MEHVFVSYVRENSEVVDRLAGQLRAFGIRVWLDRQQIAPGRRWRDAIREAIADGAFFIACFSQEYVQRTRTYMNEELTLAIDELRQRRADQSWFIPVVLNKCALPDRSIGAGETLASIQNVALYENWEEGIRRIVSVIRPSNRLGRELRPPRAAGTHAAGAVPRTDLCAIDFGTTVSCIAVLDAEQKPFFIPAPNGRAFIPSVVTFEPTMDYWVGWDALELATTYPDRTVFNIKRLVGSSREVEIAQGKFSAEVLASLVVASLKKNAEDFLGRPVTRALVSMPANFSIVQANSLARAVELAGIKVERLIGEPNAASLLLHGILPQRAERGGSFYVLALDLGGGTFDVSVLDVWDDVYEELAVAGNNSLGGADYDEVLYRLSLDKIEARLGPTHTLSPQDRMRLRLEATRAKIALGSSETTSILLPDVELTGQGLEDLHIDVSRESFRHLTTELNGLVETCIRRALGIARIDPARIQLVLLAGQGLKIFTVVELVERLFPKIPKETRFQEGAVVRGLCYYTGVLTGASKMRELLLLDANYTSIGIKCVPQASRIDETRDFLVSPDASHNTETFQILPVSSTIPTMQTRVGGAAGTGDVCMFIVEGGTLEHQPETIVTKVQLPGLRKDDKFGIRIDVDGNRTLVLWVANPRMKEIHGYQLNNPFKQPVGGNSPEFFEFDLFRRGIKIEGFRVLPIIKVGAPGTGT